jgi:hypothetical protein
MVAKVIPRIHKLNGTKKKAMIAVHESANGGIGSAHMNSAGS